MIDRLRSLVLMLCMLVLLGGVAAWIFSLTDSGKNWLGDTFGAGELPVIDFGTLEASGDKGALLLCPESYCLQPGSQPAPIWAVSAGDLMNAVINHMDARLDVQTARMDIPAGNLILLSKARKESGRTC